ncbi:MAG: 23S rRNA (pseudouridine(1915)-N(3))-methyltransferase RlmH [Clostridia bacterium]|nr:23S rRNA (pseudouridine(1915)-N(3))-methyltransferase RlmH [Clostridia bacterium]
MLHLKLITVGTLKESYLREAVAEYSKRISAYCRLEIVSLKEARLPDDPAPAQIAAALRDESERILAAIPPRATKIALCVEGKQLDSPALAELFERAAAETGCICAIIGSSHGLDETVKAACPIRLSVSKLTFPHQLMQVILLEASYRALSIVHGGKYHK